MIDQNENDKFRGFKFLEHTLVPTEFIRKHMFSLSAWEIRVILFFFSNLYSFTHKRYFDEVAITNTFIRLTQDLSETMKATPNIVKMTLAALCKKGYLKLSRKKESDGSSKLYYSLRVDFSIPETKTERGDDTNANLKQVTKRILERNNNTQNDASIEFVEESDVNAASNKKSSEESEELKHMTSLFGSKTQPKENVESDEDISSVVENLLNKKGSLKQKVTEDDQSQKIYTSSFESAPELSFNRDEIGDEDESKDDMISFNVEDNSSASDESDRNISDKIDISAIAREIEDDISKADDDINGQSDKDMEEARYEFEEFEKPGAEDDNDQQLEPMEKIEQKKEKEQPKEDKKPVASFNLSDEDDEQETYEHSVSEKKDTPVSKKKLSPEEERGKEIWDQVLSQMHILLDNMTYNTWLKPSEYLKFEDGMHYIWVEHAKFYDKFRKQWGNLLDEVIMVIDPTFKFEFASE